MSEPNIEPIEGYWMVDGSKLYSISYMLDSVPIKKTIVKLSVILYDYHSVAVI